MYSVRYGGRRGKKYSLEISDNLVATRTSQTRPLRQALTSRTGIEALGRCEHVAGFPDAGVDVHQVKVSRGARAVRDSIRKTLKKEKTLRFAGRVLVDRKSKRPVLYTENAFVKFNDEASTRKCRTRLRDLGLQVKAELAYAANAFFVAAKDGTGLEIFKMCDRLLEDELVEFCHPELIREVRRRAAFPPQWHLKKTEVNGKVVNQHASIEAAWTLTQGEGVTIAVIDDGVDIDHEEFVGDGKIVAPRDVTRKTNDPRPLTRDNHGTACAGVACASGQVGASGVAPMARLMPIRLNSGLGSQAEADAFVWAADHGAGVISCSWGPADGDWWDEDDPLHQQVFALPDSTRLAIDYAITQGRGGKGCVICWAAGNGDESVDNDRYASYDQVIAVAACSDRGKKSVYSDHGDAIWCCFPSNDFGPPEPLTPGIWTTDRSGAAGYNPAETGGDPAGNYTDGFGGTSSACPGAAGVAALVLARNPDLRWDQVKDVLKRCCDRIDAASGGYDAQGHSSKYGYGRLNGKKAVELAAPPVAVYTARHTAIQAVEIKDLATSKIQVEVGDTRRVKRLAVSIVVEHTWIGDLVVRVVPPTNLGLGPVVLHDREGGGAHNLKRTYDATSTPALAAIEGQSPQGAWTLEVEDRARDDIGKILEFTVEVGL